MIHFDTHAHVYEKLTAVPGARYVPKCPAPLEKWLAHQDRCGLRGGVIVQVSFLGTDNSELCSALAKLDRARFAGVAVVPLDVSDRALDDLVAAGVRGLRWNLVRGAVIPDVTAPETQAFLARLRDRDLHLELHLEGPRLAPVLPVLVDQGVKIVVDHFGLPSDPDAMADPMMQAVAGLADRSGLFFKFAAHYRTPFDLAPHADRLLSLLPEGQVVWGSDWPHTQHEARTGYGDVWAKSSAWSGFCDRQAVRRLYGIG